MSDNIRRYIFGIKTIHFFPFEIFQSKRIRSKKKINFSLQSNSYKTFQFMSLCELNRGNFY